MCPASELQLSQLCHLKIGLIYVPSIRPEPKYIYIYMYPQRWGEYMYPASDLQLSQLPKKYLILACDEF